jgi:hypothetical protein
MGLLIGDPICRLRGQFEETAKHILLECESLERRRTCLFGGLYPLGDECPNFVGRVLELIKGIELELQSQICKKALPLKRLGVSLHALITSITQSMGNSVL